MALIDTSFLYAYFQKNDAHHQDALEMSKVLDEQGAFISMAVFQELMTLLNYKTSSKTAQEIGTLLLSQDSPVQVLRLDEAHFDEIWALFQQLGEHSFSFVDCGLLYLAKEFEVPLFTFDKALADKAG